VVLVSHAAPVMESRTAEKKLVLAAALLLASVAGRAFAPNLIALLQFGRPAPGLAFMHSEVAKSVSSLMSAVTLAIATWCVLGLASLRPVSLTKTLWVIYMLVIGAAGLLSGFLPYGSFLVASAALLALHRLHLPAQDIIQAIAPTILTMMMFTLGVTFLAPELAAYSGVGGEAFTRELRIAGAFATPNEAGNIAAVSVVLSLASRRHPRLVRYAWTSSSLLVLMLTQSYTAWFSCVIGVSVLMLARARGKPHFRLVAILASVAALSTTARTTVLADASADVTTVNGRALAWEYVLQNWGEAPFLGHGPGIWHQLIISQRLPEWAVHAHNQLLNTLFVAGVLGVLALIVAVFATAVSAAQRWQGGLAAGAALLSLQLARSVSEVPFEIVFGGFNLFVVLVILALSTCARTADER
jgi:O-antigen ligase